MDLPDTALYLFKILRDLVCSVTQSESSEAREGKTLV